MQLTDRVHIRRIIVLHRGACSLFDFLKFDFNEHLIYSFQY